MGIRKKKGYIKGSKNAVSESELALLARSMIKRMKSSQKDIAVKIGVTTSTLSRMLNGQIPIGKTYLQIKMLFNSWRASKINCLRSEIATLKKFKT